MLQPLNSTASAPERVTPTVAIAAAAPEAPAAVPAPTAAPAATPAAAPSPAAVADKPAVARRKTYDSAYNTR